MPIHYELFKINIDKILETEKLPKFLYFLLSDPIYGTITQTKDPRVIADIQEITNLYVEWIDSGNKPVPSRWIDAQNKVNNIIYSAFWAADVAIQPNKYQAFDSVMSAIKTNCYYIGTQAVPHNEEMEKVFLDYLERLQEPVLYSLEDYDTP